MRALVFTALLVAACGSPSPRGGDGNGVDGPGDNGVGLPAWMLEDVQPESPRSGQTYGVDSFTGKVIVVSLLEGF